MKTIRIAIIGLAIAQAIIWVVILKPGYAPERIEQCVTILAAVLTLIAALRITRLWATMAQFGQITALATYVVVTVLWAQHDSEVIEGILFLVMSGAIALWIAPPLISLAALTFLKRSMNKNGPNKVPEDTARKLADPQH